MLNDEELVAQLRTYERLEQTIGSLTTQVVRPTELVDSSVLMVFMHGYGAPPDDLVGLAGPLLIECFRLGVRPVMAFPGAPIELDFGGAAWWPLNMARLMEAAAKNTFDQMREEVPPGIDDARSAVVEVVQSLVDEYQTSFDRLLLGGFSQGAMIAMDVATRGLSTPPAALGLWSGACICESLWRSNAGNRLKGTHAFQSHGRFDQILPFQTGEYLNEVVRDLCASVQFIEFAGGHQIPDECLLGVARLAAKLASAPAEE